MDHENTEEINNESDQDHGTGYYLRSKRRKLDKSVASPRHRKVVHQHETVKRKNPIMHVPTEIIQNVFNYISFHELSNKVRLVNRRFRTIAENILNVSFKNMEKKLQTLIKVTYDSLQFTQDDMEIKCACKLLNMLEIINIQSLPAELSKIIQMTKTFCVHFDKITEEPMSNSLINSGCKIIDLLECALFAQKTTIFERSSSDTFSAKYCYYFNNAWFIALPINATKEMSWKQKQRMMHMRLRRIVLAHSDMYLQQAQYERELMLRSDVRSRLKKPGNNVYTGYGDVEDTFFYYGVMNDGAYIQKFHPDEENDEEDDEEDIHEPQVNINNNVNINLEEMGINPSDENILYRIPHLGVRVDVSIRCPLSYAPQKYIEGSQLEKIKLHDKPKIRGQTELHMLFDCYGGYYPRLPTHYEYDFKPTKTI